MNELQIGIIGLVKSALTGEKADIPIGFDWDSALATAKKHQIIPMLYYGVQNSEINVPEEKMQKLKLATIKNILTSEAQLDALAKIYKAFDENEISYMPLKGSVLKYVYRKSEMRPMSDADILIRQDQYEKIRSMMLKLGFTEGIESDHELIWEKEGVLKLELHKRLIPSYIKDYYEYYSDEWRFAEWEENFRWKMRDEDNYIYLFTHYAKHYRDGGIGIRHMTDLYVFSTTHPNLDYKYIEKELKKLQLLKFYKNTKHTLDVWFCCGETDDMSDFITDKVFGSGSYGTHSAHLLSAAVKKTGEEENKGKIGRKLVLERMFPPSASLVTRYKCLEKCPALLPLVWVVRFLQLPFNRGSINRNLGVVKTTAADKVIAYRDELEFVGLKFNFEE